VIPAIAQLVDAIEGRWHGCNHDERRFCDIAVAALNDARLGDALTMSSLVRWFNHERGPVPQVNLEASFGEPPLTLGSTSRFYVEALFWLDGTTTIHQHRFSGAFMVLDGSSIHTRYRFACTQRVNASTEIGELALDGVEFLRPGQVRPIRSGTATIHSLFHLARPTLSIVVRTALDPDAAPQFDYWPPCIARVPSAIDGRLRRQIQLLRTLGRVAAPDRFVQARELLERSDFGTALPILDAMVAANPDDWPAVRDLAGTVQAGHPEITCDLVAVLAERRRVNLLVSRRRQVHDPELRLFLAMLINLPTQAACLEFLRGYAPDRDCEQLLASWIERLAARESAPDSVALLLQPLIA
jgi:hypothetical protein